MDANYKNKYYKYKIKYLALKNIQKGGASTKFENYFEGYEIIKELGKGFVGTVYLVKDIKTEKKYAMKVENVFKNDIKKTTRSRIWREQEFSDTMTKKYPNQIMKIYKIKNKKCNFTQEINNLDLNSKQNNKLKKRHNLPFCSIKILSIVDAVLYDIIYKINDKQTVLDLFIQIIYIAYLINKEGYTHNDLHDKNIGVVYTKDKYITILNKKIKTHGYLLNAIDYNKVIHKKYILSEYDQEKLKYNIDYYYIFKNIILKIMLKNMIEKYPEINIHQKVTISDEHDKILNKYVIYQDNLDLYLYNKYKEILYKILFFDTFQEQLNIKDKVKLFTFIPVDSVIFMIQNLNNFEKILKHIINI
jgi:hypothetical protein